MLALAASLHGLSCDRESPGPAPSEMGQRVPAEGSSASASTTPTPIARPLAAPPPGSPISSKRTIAVAIYTKAPPTPQQLEAAKKRVRDGSPGLPFVDDIAKAQPPFASVVSPPIAEHAPPDERQLGYFGRGLDDEERKAASASKGALLASWLIDGDPELQQLRKSQEVAAELAAEVKGTIWDELTRELYSVAEWRKVRLETWQGNLPAVNRHFVIHYYETDGGQHRSVTLGLEKLGLPDLCIPDIPPNFASGAHFINAVAQLLAEGRPVGESGKLEVDLQAIKHDDVRKTILEASESTAAKKVTITLSIAEPQQGDAENRLLEIRFDGLPGATELEREGEALAQLFGKGPAPTQQRETDGAELDRIKEDVQKKLPALAAAFRAGLALGEGISVKAPFETDSGGTEWMWVKVDGWEGELVKGVLDNHPHDIKGLSRGAKVQVKQSGIADYIWMKKDGSIEGGESTKVIKP